MLVMKGCRVMRSTAPLLRWFALGSGTFGGRCLCSRAARSFALGLVPTAVLPHPPAVLLTQPSALGELKEVL